MAQNNFYYFVSNHNLYFSRIINEGSDDLTYLLAQKYGLELKEADRLKIDFGLDHRNVSVNFPLATGIGERGEEIKVFLSDIYST